MPDDTGIIIITEGLGGLSGPTPIGEGTGAERIGLVSADYVVETFLKNIPLGDYSLDKVQEIIYASQGELEDELELTFSPKQYSDERHDYYYVDFEDFLQTFALQQLHHWPIISIDSMTLKLGDLTALEVDEDWFMVDKELGTLELLPTTTEESGPLFSLILRGLVGLGLSTSSLGAGGWPRIPLFYHITYTAGLDWDNLDRIEQSPILYAIARRTAINLLQKLDETMGLSSRSVNQDGVSQSWSYTASAMYGQYSAQIEQYKKDELRWIDSMRRKYAKGLRMVVA